MLLLVKGARVISPAQGIDAEMDVLVQDGKITALGHDLPAAGAEVVEAAGMLLVPGFIDLHTHMGEPGREDRETLETGAAAAARGGYTTVLMMPDTDPPLDNAPAIAQAVTRGKHALVRILVAGSLTKHLEGSEMTELAAMRLAGAAAFAQPDRPIPVAGLLRRILQYNDGLLPLVIEQPYDASLVADGMMHEGVMSTIYGIKGIPTVAEEVAVARDILIAEETGARLHLAKISTAGSVRLIAEAKARGIAVTCDVSPYHLVFSDASLERYDPNFKFMPPLRSVDHTKALRQALASGIIDCVATDHTPLTPEEKDVEFSLAPYGAVGLETTFALLHTELVLKGELSLNRLVEALACKPAELLAVQGVAATLQPGCAADFVVINPTYAVEVNPSRLVSMGRNTPLANRCLTGWPIATYVAGKRVFQEGEQA